MRPAVVPPRAGCAVLLQRRQASKLFTTAQLVLDFSGYEDATGAGRGNDFGVRSMKASGSTSTELRLLRLRRRDARVLALAAVRARRRCRLPGATGIRFVHRSVMPADHFSTIAARYAAYRPRYPQALVDALADAAPPTTRVGRRLRQRPARRCRSPRRFARVDRDRSVAGAARRRDAASARRVSVRARRGEWPARRERRSRGRRAGGALVRLAALRRRGRARRAARRRSSRSSATACMHRRRRGGRAGRALLSRRSSVRTGRPSGAHVENGYRDLALPWPAVEAPAIAMTRDVDARRAARLRRDVVGDGEARRAARAPRRVDALSDALAAVVARR